ncbi:nucleotidyltransferase domain-containing protein [Granulicella tundricola]|uniref:DNA polymerase beta domain protein region n=1 Tax=Granulicella tundricola (strain ATCC BAA-1859 / DSM 23138 / MP5ACTX9) TaxID=1198114 RepID=E8X3E3_GRATM|nr:nucleotidyltransferase domain-containing protein [Granulicella tundricola]ADW70444.1 DNA polymerase beta domain protein region [Granulicella tundricola MP5ACTX9]
MIAAQSLAAVMQNRLQTSSEEVRRLLQNCEEIIVFGSYAAGLSTSASDLDIFCIGNERKHLKSKAIDLLVLRKEDVRLPLWLGSELASHIKEFGVPLTGEHDWLKDVTQSLVAITKKENRINAYSRSLNKHWMALNGSSKKKYSLKVRRELQRLSILVAKHPVPPTKILDQLWSSPNTRVSEELRVFSIAKRLALSDTSFLEPELYDSIK